MKHQKKAVAIIGESIYDLFKSQIMDSTFYTITVIEIEKLIEKGYTRFAINPRTDFEQFALTILESKKLANQSLEIILTDEEEYDDVLDLSERILTFYAGSSELLQMIHYATTAHIPITNVAQKLIEE